MSVNIMIDEGKYRITSDDRNWMLEEKQKKSWKTRGYYSSLPSLLEGLGNLKLRQSTARSMGELGLNVMAIREELCKIENQVSFSRSADSV